MSENTTRVAACILMLFLLSSAAPIKVDTSPVYIFGIPGLTPTATGAWASAFGLFAFLWREIRLDRKLSSEDREARREGYAAQVASLSTENRKLREDLRASDDRHAAYRKLCQEETDQLRDEVRQIKEEFDGWKRKVLSYGESAGHLMQDMRDGKHDDRQ